MHLIYVCLTLYEKVKALWQFKRVGSHCATFAWKEAPQFFLHQGSDIFFFSQEDISSPRIRHFPFFARRHFFTKDQTFSLFRKTFLHQRSDIFFSFSQDISSPKIRHFPFFSRRHFFQFKISLLYSLCASFNNRLHLFLSLSWTLLVISFHFLANLF